MKYGIYFYVRGISPFGKTSSVKTVIAQNGQNAIHRLVHSLQTDRADRQFSHSRHGWAETAACRVSTNLNL